MTDHQKYKEKKVPELELDIDVLSGLKIGVNKELFAPVEDDIKTASKSIDFGHLATIQTTIDDRAALHRSYYEAGRSPGHFYKRHIHACKRLKDFITKEVKQVDDVKAFNNREDVRKVDTDQIKISQNLLGLEEGASLVKGDVGESGEKVSLPNIEILPKEIIEQGKNLNDYWHATDDDITFASVVTAKNDPPQKNQEGRFEKVEEDTAEA